ncbi:MAG TPA: hypothetical protein PLY90_10350 [Candidatus Hydrogenedentes bacterium]|jgi:hypothetical protein|nr:hypothetical protein [Candidatus Hydrogenedentota bacterium]
MTLTREQLTGRLVLNAVLPVIRVMLEDDERMKDRFADVTGTVQFEADDPDGKIGAWLLFDRGKFEVTQGFTENPDVLFSFSSLKAMNDMFRGKPVLPRLGALLPALMKKPGLVIRVFKVLFGLKLLMPAAKPKNAEQAHLKVKMTLYMVSTALSQMNKAGDTDMQAWTAKQPERIYQWSVDGTDIACYLKVKAGKTKAGRGVHTGRKPFVHMSFKSVDAALPVLANTIDTVSAIGQGLVLSDGSPEYGGKLGDFMMKVANLLS